MHNGVRAPAGDIEGRKKLAQYMLRAPLSLEKMTYLPDAGMVVYRSHMHKGLKRNFQLMPGAQWLELLCRHIPDRFEHLVRYGRKNVFLDPIPIGKHPPLVAARAEIPRLARKR